MVDSDITLNVAIVWHPEEMKMWAFITKGPEEVLYMANGRVLVSLSSIIREQDIESKQIVYIIML